SLAREADRPLAAVPLLPGHLHAAVRTARTGPKPSARDLCRAVRGVQPGAARLGREPEICWHRPPRLLRRAAHMGPDTGLSPARALRRAGGRHRRGWQSLAALPG